MPDTSYEFLVKFFENYLPFTPTPGQVAVFQNDLSLVSPYLMEAALVELKNGSAGKRPGSPVNGGRLFSKFTTERWQNMPSCLACSIRSKPLFGPPWPSHWSGITITSGGGGRSMMSCEMATKLDP